MTAKLADDRLSILIVAEQDIAGPFAAELARRGDKVRQTADPAGAVAQTVASAPDLVLVAPQASLLSELVGSVRDNMQGQPPLVIALVDFAQHGQIEAALQAGVDDVLPRKLNPSLLLAKLRWLRSVRPFSGRPVAMVTDRAHGGLDPVTGLPNRFLFDDRLNHALYRAKRELFKVATLLIDLDGFRQVNERYGEEACELVLRQIGARLLAALRKTDTIARIGRDKFAVLLERAEQQDDVAMLARRFIDRVNLPVEFGGVPLTLGASVGVALFPIDGSDAEQLHKAMDLAMYKAKTSGKNTYAFISERQEQDICMLNPS